MIAEHVLRHHRYLPPGVEEGTPAHDILSQPLAVEGPDAAAAEGDEEEESPWEKYDPLLHVGVGQTTSRRTTRSQMKKVEILSIKFVKKYIQYAKNRPLPVLTKGAADHVVQVYANLRNEDMAANQKKVRCLIETSTFYYI